MAEGWVAGLEQMWAHQKDFYLDMCLAEQWEFLMAQDWVAERE